MSQRCAVAESKSVPARFNRMQRQSHSFVVTLVLMLSCRHAMLWLKYSASPEVFNTQTRQAEVRAWPLRPELVESTLFLYQATKHHSYLELGERIILDIVNRTKVDCGLAALANIQTGEQENRMHSFVLAETLPVSTPTHLLRRY